MPCDVAEILKIRACPRLSQDTIAWGPGIQGQFSVRSAYAFVVDLVTSEVQSTSLQAGGCRPVWKMLWKIDVPPTVKHFAWRLATDSLPTWNNKWRRQLESSPTCPICGRGDEDNFHPFLVCPKSVELWKKMSSVWPIPSYNEVIHTDPEWLLNALVNMRPQNRPQFLLVLWRIWFVRNEIVHDKIPPPTDISCKFLVSYFDTLSNLKQDVPPVSVKGKTPVGPTNAHEIIAVGQGRTWSKPQAGWTKLNCDGSFDDKAAAGSGMVLRDSDGLIIFSSCRQLFNCRDPLEAELGACMEGLSLALSRTELPIAIEMDSLLAVKMIQSRDDDRSLYCSLVREIKHLRSLRETSITHIYRQQNRVSNSLANFARSEARTITWLGSGPTEVLELNASDCNPGVL